MKKFFVMLLTLIMGIGCIGFIGCGDSEGKTLNVYTNAGFAPYEYVNENGQVVGVDIDIMKEVGEVLGYKVVIKDIDFNQILVEVAKDEYAVGAAGMTKRPDRDEVALATNIYATSVQYVIVPTGTFGEADLVDGKPEYKITSVLFHINLQSIDVSFIREQLSPLSYLLNTDIRPTSYITIRFFISASLTSNSS